ncbi:DAO-domain-containing protein [Sparassis crispa]|uniref:DAO-domain-containing protein n=1 Tax=Sparassis crispa TaxID=139825 RepID=A0A401GLH7_9APHY|nr:DAO-domain-containing protein [Sparassis crispa]GBE83026.1 DAO-domain-containing protein [Sparassis crispa]
MTSEPPSTGPDTPASTEWPLPEGSSLSLWLQCVRANPLLDYRSVETLPTEADVVIIGSGISGALVAFELLKSANPPSSIMMLEARELCSGATGRNAGHCKPDQWRGFRKYKSVFGEQQALKILANEQETWERLVAFIREEKVDCDLWVGDTLDVAVTTEVAEDMASVWESYKAAGGKVDHVKYVADKEEAVKISRLKSAVSLWAWNASTLYPWKLVAYVIQKTLDLGLHLQTWTPATSVTASRKSGQWEVKTERGTITTPMVVHATNAYASALLPEFKGIIRPTPHMCDKVVPPRSFSGSHALQNSYGVLCSGGSLYSINPRTTSDGIVLFGGSNPNQGELFKYVDEDPERRSTDDSLSNFAPVTQAVIELTQKDFIGWGTKTAPGQGYEYSWSGIIGRSADGVPYVGAVPGKPGQWIIGGHNGHGMARIFTAAPGLVKLIQGGIWSDTGLPECFEVTAERLARLHAQSNFNIPFV